MRGLVISLYYLQFVVQILLTSGYGLVVCAFEKASSLKFEYCDCSIKIRILPLVHTTSNLVWFLITDYGEQLGCPWGWSWRSSQIWGSWSQRYLFDLKDHHKYQARWGILATVFLSSPQSFGIISVKIWRIRLQRIERMIMTPKWKTVIMMIFTKNLSDLSNFQDQIK